MESLLQWWYSINWNDVNWVVVWSSISAIGTLTLAVATFITIIHNQRWNKRKERRILPFLTVSTENLNSPYYILEVKNSGFEPAIATKVSVEIDGHKGSCEYDPQGIAVGYSKFLKIRTDKARRVSVEITLLNALGDSIEFTFQRNVIQKEDHAELNLVRVNGKKIVEIPFTAKSKFFEDSL